MAIGPVPDGRKASERPNSGEAPARLAWLDHAKGIGIFLVVLGHVIRGLRNAGLGASGPGFQSLDAWIYAFHMPLFFLLAGLFAERRIDRGPREFLLDKAATIAYPYFVWSAIQTGMQILMSGSVNHQAGLDDLLAILILPPMQFWFLYALFLIVCLYYALRRLGLGPYTALAAFVGLRAFNDVHSLGAWPPLASVAINGVYYALGPLWNRAAISSRLERSPIVALAVSAMGYALVLAWILWRPAAPQPFLAFAAALAGVSATIALATQLPRVPGLGFIRMWGAASLEIYVAHTICSAALRIALQRVFKIDSVPVHLAVGTFGGLLLPLLLADACRRLAFPYLFRLPTRPTTRPA